jgi:hypothetical protein
MVLCLLPSMALGQTPFYQGKTITFIQARTPGGSGDLRVRAILPVLAKHIPGNPNIVMQFMDGFGGRKAANHIYKGARPDGLTIANLSASTIPLAVLGESGVEYDIDKLVHLGTFYSVRHTVFITAKTAGLDNLEKLRAATGVRIGEQSVGFPSYIRSRFFAWLLGLKDPKFVTGYSSPEIDAALMQGEVDARQHSAGSLLVQRPEWIKKKLVDLHVMMEVPEGAKHPDFAHLPEIGRFPKPSESARYWPYFVLSRFSGSQPSRLLVFLKIAWCFCRRHSAELLKILNFIVSTRSWLEMIPHRLCLKRSLKSSGNFHETRK